MPSGIICQLTLLSADAQQVETPDSTIVYHCMDNAMYYHGEDVQSLVFPLVSPLPAEQLLTSLQDMASSIKYLLCQKKYVAVSSIPGLKDE